MIDVDLITATIAGECPKLRALGGRTDTLSTQTETDAKPEPVPTLGLIALRVSASLPARLRYAETLAH
jgi:hypothetical protein